MLHILSKSKDGWGKNFTQWKMSEKRKYSFIPTLFRQLDNKINLKKNGLKTQEWL